MEKLNQITINFQVPLLLLIFNRPDTTVKVFNSIRKFEPRKLFIACDGPRHNNKTDLENVQQVRNYIIDAIDWQCDVHTLFREKNLGCKIAVSSAIDWFFDHNEMGIILEDDCVPHLSFFKFCEELLIKYKDEKQVMQISGYNAMNRVSLKESYYFAKFGPIWGWASWRRAWKHYDVQMKAWEKTTANELNSEYCDSRLEALWRIRTYNKIYRGEINTWDYQWSFAKLINKGLSIIPFNNLVYNIGFGENATHTKNLVHQKIQNNIGINFPLQHPEKIMRNKKLDKKYFNQIILKGYLNGIINKIMGK